MMLYERWPEDQSLTHVEKQEFPAEFPSDIPPAVTWAEILFRAFGSIKRPKLDNNTSPNDQS